MLHHSLSHLNRLVPEAHKDLPLALPEAAAGDLELLLQALQVVEVLHDVPLHVHVDPLQDARLRSDEDIEVRPLALSHPGGRLRL